jgi:nucleoside-diphosphate-sugar epimerase
MRVLFVGGTGLISSACSDLAIERGIELFVLNRSTTKIHPIPAGVQQLTGDVHGDELRLARLLHGMNFDVVVDWIAYTPQDIERDIRLFRDNPHNPGSAAGQFIFISSATVYEKPPSHYLVTEETARGNPFSEYARNKIASEDRLMQAAREQGFPVTIVRPSLTYGPTLIPLCVNSWQQPYTVIDRMKKGKKVIAPGDGNSLWVVTWNGDFAKGFVGLFGRQEALGQAYHITSDEVLTWDQLYREAAQAAGVEPQIVHIPSDLIAAYWPHATASLIGDKINSTVFDNSKIKALVPDYECSVPWAEGVRRALAWFEADPARMSIDSELDATCDRILAGYEKAFPHA